MIVAIPYERHRRKLEIPKLKLIVFFFSFGHFRCCCCYFFVSQLNMLLPGCCFFRCYAVIRVCRSCVSVLLRCVAIDCLYETLEYHCFYRFDLFPFHLMLFKLVPDIVCVRRCVFFFIFSKPLFSIFILLVSFHSIISFVSFFQQQLYQARNKILLTNEKKNTKLEKKNREKTHTRTPNSSINSLY